MIQGALGGLPPHVQAAMAGLGIAPKPGAQAPPQSKPQDKSQAKSKPRPKPEPEPDRDEQVIELRMDKHGVWREQ